MSHVVSCDYHNTFCVRACRTPRRFSSARRLVRSGLRCWSISEIISARSTLVRSRLFSYSVTRFILLILPLYSLYTSTSEPCLLERCSSRLESARLGLNHVHQLKFIHQLPNHVHQLKFTCTIVRVARIYWLGHCTVPSESPIQRCQCHTESPERIFADTCTDTNFHFWLFTASLSERLAGANSAL